jgi:hypothetical protein
MLRLKESSKFQKEFKKYKSVIDKIDNKSVQQQGYKLVSIRMTLNQIVKDSK